MSTVFTLFLGFITMLAGTVLAHDPNGSTSKRMLGTIFATIGLVSMIGVIIAAIIRA